MNSKPRIWLYLVILLIASVLTGACAGGASAPTANAELRKVRIVLLPYASYAPFHVGFDQGVFREHGLELVPVDVRRSSEAVSVLAEGDIDVVPGLLFPGLFNAIGRGAEIRVVAGANYFDPAACTGHAVVARPDLHLDPDEPGTAAAALKGARVSVNPPSLTGYITDSALATAGLSLEDVEIVDIQSSAEPHAFTEGSLDLGFVSEPRLSRLVDDGTVEIWQRAEQLLPNQQFAAVFFGPSLLQDDPELGTRFLRAYLEVLNLYSEGKTARNLESVAQFLELEPDFVKDTCWETYPTDGSVQLQSLVDFQHWAAQHDYVDRVLEPDEFWDGSLLQAARGEAAAGE